MISQSAFAWPGGSCALRQSWTRRSVLVCVQHPGEGLPSSYPYLGDSVPRPGVAHIYRA